MTPREAIQRVRDEFPFPGYVSSDDTGYLATVEPVLRHLKPGARVLDFGSGPCDQTAILQLLGFRCSAWDDLQDEWHLVGDNRQKILAFAEKMGIDFRLADGGPLPFEKQAFDLVMLIAVLEHLHDAPRELLNDLLELLRPGGYLYIMVPSAVNIRKRLSVLVGHTNYARYGSYYWYPGKTWRGHVREYTRHDLRQLAGFLGLSIVELRSCHKMLEVVPRRLRQAYLLATALFPGWRDSWLLLARKGADWQPRRTPDAANAVAGQRSET